MPEDADEEDEIPGGDVAYDFSGPERTTDDIAIGRRLIERAHALGDPDPETPEYIERGDAFRFGMTLLSSAEVSDVAALLSVPDEHVQQAARDRLEEIGGPEAESALRAYDEQFARYVTESADRLRAAGLTATADGDALRVVEGNLSLNMPVFFARRHATDADVQFLDMVKRLAESRRDRAPQKKKGHRGKR